LAEEKVSTTDYAKDVIKVTKDLNKAKAELKKLKNKFELYGSDITQSDIDRQQKLVDFYEQTLNQLTEESSRSEEEKLQAKIETKQRQLEELTSRKKPEELTAGEKIGAIRSGRIKQPTKTSIEKLEQEITNLQERYNQVKTEEEVQAPVNITDKAQGVTQTFGLRPTIDILPNSKVSRNNNGTFKINDNDDQIFVYDGRTTILRPQSTDSFKNTLYTLTPDAIAEYKKGLGYKAEDINGVLTDKFKDDMLDVAKAVSEYSFGYAQSGLKQPVDIIKYLSSPDMYPEVSSIIKQQKSGGTGGGIKIDANKLAANVDTVKLLEAELGVSLTKEQRNKIARDLATGRVNATTLPSTISKMGKLSVEEGEAASVKAELKQLAAANGVDLGEPWFDNATKNILQGKTAKETISAEILKQAKLKYSAPSVVSGLDAGFSVRDQATQYINWIAQVRGVDPKNISLDDPIISKAFTNRNQEGMPVQMSLYDWQDWAKQNDPTYAYSSMAEEAYVSTLRAIGQAFGKSI
jgi:hypothetical protein